MSRRAATWVSWPTTYTSTLTTATRSPQPHDTHVVAPAEQGPRPCLLSVQGEAGSGERRLGNLAGPRGCSPRSFGTWRFESFTAHVKAPVGAEVGLYIDHRGTVDVGDEIETRSGRRYLVVKTRQQTRGQNIGRWHLRCVVLAPDAERDPDSRV